MCGGASAFSSPRGRLLGELPEHEAEVLCIDRDAAMISRHETGQFSAESRSRDHLA